MMNPAEFANIAQAEEDFWWYRGMRRILFRLLDGIARRDRLDVLEAGCGTGHLARMLQDRYGWRLYPLDLGWEGLMFGRQMGIERLVQGDLAQLPFPESSFDAVVCMDVIVHFPRGEEDRPMAELARVLKPKGLLALRVSALDALRSRHSMFAMERQRFTRSRLLELARRHRIQPLRVTYANSLLLPVALAKFRLWEPLLRKEPASGVQPLPGWLDNLLYAPLAAEAALLRAGMDLPIGQSLILLGEKR